MLSREEFERKANEAKDVSASVSTGFVSDNFVPASLRQASNYDNTNPAGVHSVIPQLMLFNDTLGIRVIGINGAIIGRRQGPYTQQFQQHMYISGVHAQLKYNATSGWCIADKHSSNGTKLNDHQLQPDVDMSMKNGDILTIANIALQVSIN